MKDIRIPKNAILTGRSALEYYNILDTDTTSSKLTIEMVTGTNPSSYTNYVINTQSKETITIGTINISGISIYRIERLFIELEKFNLKESEFDSAYTILKKSVNKNILIDIMNKIQKKRRGINWKRLNDFISNKQKIKDNSKIMLLKKLLKDLVFSISKIEIPTLTFLDTEKIIEDLPTDGIRPSQIEVVLSLKKAFELLISSQEKCNTYFIKSVNFEVAKGTVKQAGKIRNHSVVIEGTNYIPPVPTIESFNNFFNQILSIKDIRIRAATFAAKATKMQFFSDGNKRTALVIANKLLIDEAEGVLIMPDIKRGEYLKLLKEYYEDDNKEEQIIDFIKQFIFKDDNERVVKLLQMNILKQ